MDTPTLYRFGLAELRRMVVIGAVLAWSLARAMIGWLVRRRGRPAVVAASEAAVAAFEKLGPTFIKLGQLMASSPGVFPEVLSVACRRCLHELGPFDGETAREVIRADLGRPASEIFQSFDADSPLATGSVAQVHACVLPDGRQAVVKLQRPGIAPGMITDLRILYRGARRLHRLWGFARDANFPGAIEDLHRVTCGELNFVVEADRQARFRDGITAFGDNLSVTAPKVYWEYCGPHTICMERLFGVPIDQFGAVRDRQPDVRLLLRQSVKVWTEACLLHGPFHGDVHAGNIWALDDGRAAFLDFGIMGELDDDWKQLMRDLFRTSTIDDDYTRVARAFKRVGAFPENGATDAEIGEQMRIVFSPMFDTGLAQLSFAELLGAIIRSMGDHSGGAGTPRELHLIVKQLLYIERYAKEFAPDWTMFRDLYLIRNVFPEEAASRAGELGLVLPA